ncbi:uncharacterized protein N7506_001588 [Penicillium brevicompactum]|uniref:uncharacterized protein n=1 Tax=Penicillium brevicompactum TaxID=5074 RepID=UPI00254229B3|nr:uncharacterized protein N7506_001588 [Penicillium brevicompactum]KAJ5348335.1 hypothetical protein N7506_001588 [Penicillium brevicompactum]
MTQVSTPKSYPSVRWTSFEWDYNGMKERLESALAGLNKDALLSHSELIKGQKLFMSEKFAAGQYWICFEMVAEDGTLVIARVRLPWHPKTLPTVSEEDELYAISCEVSTMQFVAKKTLSSVVVPKVYVYEGPGSQRAIAAGAIYMLIEGFCGNTLRDVASDICDLPLSSVSFLYWHHSEKHSSPAEEGSHHNVGVLLKVPQAQAGEGELLPDDWAGHAKDLPLKAPPGGRPTLGHRRNRSSASSGESPQVNLVVESERATLQCAMCWPKVSPPPLHTIPAIQAFMPTVTPEENRAEFDRIMAMLERVKLAL